MKKILKGASGASVECKKSAPTPPAATKASAEEAAEANKRTAAELAMQGMAQTTLTAMTFAGHAFPHLDHAESLNALVDLSMDVVRGDLRQLEGTLYTQATALNAIFNDLARRSGLYMGANIGTSEIYMRLALKAQSQCRTTLETLANIKNPPTIFARQANVGQNVQVNNSAQPAVTRAEKYKNQQNKLLEVQHGERLDTRTASAASQPDPGLATVGPFDGPENEGR